MAPGTRMLSRIIAGVCAVLTAGAVVRAQSLDPGFDPGANSHVLALAVQANGQILVGGNFTTLGGGGTGTTARQHIGRLNVRGSLDTSFDPGADGDVSTIAVQPADGQILVGGDFTALGGGGTGTTTRWHIGRLLVDGSLDTSFDPGTNGYVSTIAVQPADGKIVVGGQFTTLGGGTGTTTRQNIGRVNADGSLDTSFNPGANGLVYALVVQADGKILVGGSFTMLGGGGTGTLPRNGIGRLNEDGSLDTSFDPGTDGSVFALAVQANGQILVGGNFTTLGGGATGTTTRHKLGRPNADGSLDTSFDPGASGTGQSPDVRGFAVQRDHRIVVVGDFSMLGGGGLGTAQRDNIGRLHADGSLDTTFNPGANGWVFAVASLANGKIVLGGFFTRLGGGGTGTTTREKIGRLIVDGSLDRNTGSREKSAALAPAVQPDGTIPGGTLSQAVAAKSVPVPPAAPPPLVREDRAAPTVVGIVPIEGPPTGWTVVTLTGTGFLPGATVAMGGAAATVTAVVNATTITAITPAHMAGAVSVVVTNPTGEISTLAGAFTYRPGWR
jgi:uncharacterized delta-60 repeat protein